MRNQSWIKKWLSDQYRKFQRCQRCTGANVFAYGLCLRCFQSLAFLSGDRTQQGATLHGVLPSVPVLAIFEYSGSVREMILQLKYRQAFWTVPIFGEMLVDHIRKLDINASVIIPMPMHHRRRLSRGYNQVALLASWMAKKLHMDMRMNTLMRNRNTQLQHELNKDHRIENVRGCFSVKQECRQPVILLDDVMTTGASLTEAYQALCHAGCTEIHICVVAVAEQSGDMRAQMRDEKSAMMKQTHMPYWL